jgi:hypothetical protein
LLFSPESAEPGEGFARRTSSFLSHRSHHILIKFFHTQRTPVGVTLLRKVSPTVGSRTCKEVIRCTTPGGMSPI